MTRIATAQAAQNTLDARAQAAAQDVIDRLVADDQETGIQVAAYLGGKLVVDAYAGIANPDTGAPMHGDTLINVWSAGKGVAATTVHALVERGVLDLDRPLTWIWPEFGVNGKERVTLAHVLTHSAGLPGVPPDLTPEQMADVPAMAAWLAQQAPLWEPGTATGYHAITFGYLIDEIVRRATGRSLDDVTRELVTGPLGIADSIAFSVTPEHFDRLARLVDEPQPDGAEDPMASIPPDSPILRMGPIHLWPHAALGNRPDHLAASLAAGVTASARALARLYAALAGGGELDGVRILQPESVARATALQRADEDCIVGFPYPKSLGFNLGSEGPSMVGGPTGFGYPGAGGSIAYGEREYNFAFAVAKNRMTQGVASGVEAEVRAALGLPAPEPPSFE